jgi:hypothetical protein
MHADQAFVKGISNSHSSISVDVSIFSCASMIRYNISYGNIALNVFIVLVGNIRRTARPTIVLK